MSDPHDNVVVDLMDALASDAQRRRNVRRGRHPITGPPPEEGDDQSDLKSTVTRWFAHSDFAKAAIYMPFLVMAGISAVAVGHMLGWFGATASIFSYAGMAGLAQWNAS